MSLAKLLYQPYKWLVFVPVVVINTVIMATLCVLVCLVSQRLGSRYIARPWAKINFLATPAIVTIEGEEHLQSKQSYVVVANHTSQFDILALYGWLNLDLKWVMKKELRKVPFIGFACAAMGHIFLDRRNGSAAKQALIDAKERLVDGTSVLFFPEGTRSQDGKVKAFKRGAFVMAKDLDLPILPITLVGTHEILPTGGLDVMPGKARLIIHEPIALDKVKDLDVDDLMAQAQQVVISGFEH